MKKIIILLNLIFFVSTEIIYNEEIIPKELFHGVAQNDSWEIGKSYEYYIDISNYGLNEENIFEIYGRSKNINSSDIKLYFLLTETNDVEQIKNGIIKPNKEDNIYPLASANTKLDTLSKTNYLFLPFQKTSSYQNYLIILIENIFEDEIQTLFYISKRIPIIKLEKSNERNIEVFSKEIESRSDIRLYYKIDVGKIDLIKYNVYLFINKTENNEKTLEVNYYKNFFSLKESLNNLFIFERNLTWFSEVFFGIKKNSSYNNEKHVNLAIRIDDNNLYYISNQKRSNIKIYIENIECNKDTFIIEDYIESEGNQYKRLITERLYGNYSLNYYQTLRDLNFENFNNVFKKEISNLIILLNGLVNIYILKSITPSAFTFEIFTDSDIPSYMSAGQSIKTFLSPNLYYYNYIWLYNLNIFNKYKVDVRILDEHGKNNRTFFCLFNTQGVSTEEAIIFPYYSLKKIIYSNFFGDPSSFCFGTFYNIFIEYYFTSNNLFNNIIEGRTKINANLLNIHSSNYALKIKKDILFDYISLEAKCEEIILGKYELKLIYDIDIDSNSLMVSLPKIDLPKSDHINLKISNPYDKYDQWDNINRNDNNFYLLLSFSLNIYPVYINIEYIYNEQIVILNTSKTEQIIPQKEYEIRLNLNDYMVQDKILFNINKCNNLANYTMINYYENKMNIIKETKITNSHHTILLDNKYKNSKMILNKESKEEESKNDTSIYPAIYYNQGDIILNYFLIESSSFEELKFTNDLNINYEDETFSWKEYVFRVSQNNRIDIPTNYSIYILPINSVVNTMCQMFLIPANKTVINSNEIKIELNEGEYKVAIIASVINEEMPFQIMYNIMELKINKKINVVLIVILSVLGLIIILVVILYFVFKHKKKSFNKTRNLSDDVKNFDINNYLEENNEEEEDSEENNEKGQFTQELMKMINQK